MKGMAIFTMPLRSIGWQVFRRADFSSKVRKSPSANLFDVPTPTAQAILTDWLREKGHLPK